MCVNMYVYIYICVNMYVYIYVYIYMCAHKFLYTYIFIFMYMQPKIFRDSCFIHHLCPDFVLYPTGGVMIKI